jgi:hypothetical protein
MIVKFISSEFLSSPARQRATKAREMAEDADWLATTAFNEEMRGSYLELKWHWNMLADELERIDAEGVSTQSSSRGAANSA